MFGLPLWAIQIIITILQKTGFVNWLESLAMRGGLEGVHELKKLKTYPEYPGKDDAPPTNQSNINQG